MNNNDFYKNTQYLSYYLIKFWNNVMKWDLVVTFLIWISLRMMKFSDFENIAIFWNNVARQYKLVILKSKYVKSIPQDLLSLILKKNVLRFIFLFKFFFSRKYWNGQNFRIPILDKFIPFRMFRRRFDSFQKMAICASVWDTKFVVALI